MSFRAIFGSAATAFLILLISSNVTCQLPLPIPATNSSLINSLFLNHLEHTLDRLTALSEVANLLTGGMAGLG